MEESSAAEREIQTQTQENKEKEHALEQVSQDIESLLSRLSPQDESIPEFVDKYLDLAHDKISNHESLLEVDDDSFFKLVNQISKLYKILSDSNHGPLINRIGKIQQLAMCYLEDEFMSLMEESRTNDSEAAADQPEEDQSADESNYPDYSQKVLATLNKIANEMISGGYEFECCDAYIITRRNIIEEALNKLGYQKISIDDVQKMQWEALEKEIPPWIKAFKQCVNLYFSGERKLVENIFSDHSSLSSTLFGNLACRVFIQLLNFAEAVATVKRSTEKLFKFLDIYETLRDNLSAMESMVPKECANVLRNETTTTRCQIGEMAICIFCDLENAIQSDTGKTTVPGGAVHPLTRYTMNYVKYACDEYKETIEKVFKEHSKTGRADSTQKDRDEDEQSPFVGQVLRILELLDSALDAKSKLYKDTALSCIFMMNNGRYMLQKIKGSAELHQAMRDTWCRKTSSDLRNYHNTYKRETWMKLLGCLNVEGLNVNGKVVKPVLKERFKSFNAMFDEIRKTQSSWVVNDKQLQSELRVSISAIVIPAYRSFLARFSGYLDPGRQTEKYIKFQPDDIEACIDELFDGNSGSMGRKKT
ncbi:exocyst subunit exo70 family protein C2 [Hibiscus trionum]|uniref:Exocyst subunit Exo70 family protein n=1 Tax=Hibiscus trionum TaxID=183268 RepID=A0A9W7LVP4_HIBTR|nr:exocyst subunit exo70 family protein C2 [Hibiscus trionum]